MGLGASAGGLAALEEFFSAMPPDSGMAFVVITHLHQGQPSLLHELVGRKTTMPVTEIRNATIVEPNHVYTVTPGWNLAILNGTLQPMPRDKATAVHLPIDYFFRSLAQDQKHQAIGIVLSGTGSDGTIGLKKIKSELGMVMAQQEQSASYASMPQSAIATGLVDFVVPPKEMPDKLLGYATEAVRPVGRIGPSEPEAGLRSEDLQQVFVLLRARTGHDFSQYKSSTIDRRLERRMSVHHAEDVSQYLRLLQEDSDEVDRLFKELLIGVTSFFRDPDAFEALASALRNLLATRTRSRPTIPSRVWVPGCSTGEEAYSIAILIREYMDQAKKPLSVQIFATDLDPDAIDVARAGLYPMGIAQDLSPRRLKRFFTREQEAFRIAKGDARDGGVRAPEPHRGPALHQSRPALLPEPAHLSGWGPATAAVPHLSLRPSSGGSSVSGLVGNRGFVRVSVRYPRQEGEGVRAQGGGAGDLRRRASRGHPRHAAALRSPGGDLAPTRARPRPECRPRDRAGARSPHRLGPGAGRHLAHSWPNGSLLGAHSGRSAGLEHLQHGP